MNCANHPERTATAFCQNCGKALCPECIRTADGLLLCEPCLLARPAGASAGTAWSSASSTSGTSSAAAGSPQGSTGWNAVPPVAGTTQQPGHPYGYPAGAGAPPPPYAGPSPSSVLSPLLAGFLGLIPGVGAMYNGQFVKALLHVVIFIVLIGASEHFPLMGILIAAWVFYQAFDAAQTASAKRDGRPLPDPFGILDMSHRLGPQGGFQSSNQPGAYSPRGYTPTGYPPASVPSQPGSAPYTQTQAGNAPPPGGPVHEPQWQGYPQSGAPLPNQGWTAQPPIAPFPVQPAARQRRGEPIGAIVLIVVGLLFLLSTLGILDTDWISRGWPVLVLLLGLWLLFRRARTPETFAGPPVPPSPSTMPGTATPGTSLERNPLSITPQPPAAPARQDQQITSSSTSETPGERSDTL